MIVVGVASSIWVLWGMSQGTIWTAVISLSVWAVLFVAMFYFLRRYAVKKLLTHADPSLFEKQNWHVSEQGIQIKGESYQQDLLWNQIIQSIEKEDIILLYTSKSVARIIPKKVFSTEQLQTFKNLSGLKPA